MLFVRRSSKLSRWHKPAEMFRDGDRTEFRLVLRTISTLEQKDATKRKRERERERERGKREWWEHVRSCFLTVAPPDPGIMRSWHETLLYGSAERYTWNRLEGHFSEWYTPLNPTGFLGRSQKPLNPYSGHQVQEGPYGNCTKPLFKWLSVSTGRVSRSLSTHYFHGLPPGDL